MHARDRRDPGPRECSRAWIAAAAALALAPACRGSGPAPVNKGCSAFLNGAPSIPYTARNGKPPIGQGGAIHDGVYFASRAEGYGNATPSGRHLTLIVSGGGTRFSWGGDVLDPGGKLPTLSFRANAAVAAAAGNTLTLTTTCSDVTPSPIPPQMTYTALPYYLTLSVVTGSDASVTTYTRQGS